MFRFQVCLALSDFVSLDMARRFESTLGARPSRPVDAAAGLYIPDSTSLESSARQRPFEEGDALDTAGTFTKVRYYGIGNLSFECPYQECCRSFPWLSSLQQHLQHPIHAPNRVVLNYALYVCPRCRELVPYDLGKLPKHLSLCDGPYPVHSDGRCRIRCTATQDGHTMSRRNSILNDFIETP